MQLPKYENKPFKPPRKLGANENLTIISNRTNNTNNALKTIESNRSSQTPSIKKRRVIPNASIVSEKKQNTRTVRSNENSLPWKYYTVMHRKPSNKKIKTWSGDGYAILKKDNGKISFYSESGQHISTRELETVDESTTIDTLFKAKGLEFQIDYEITDTDELANAIKIIKASTLPDNPLPEKIIQSKNNSKIISNPQIPVSQLVSKRVASKFKSVITKSKAYSPLSVRSDVPSSASHRKYLPLFDITKIENPIIMNKSPEADVDVIVDPKLGTLLREHQREGVKFIYDCVMGLSRPNDNNQALSTNSSLVLEEDSDISGCLLADDMGLGKTLMTITLIWTLLKQTPMASKVECSQSGVPLSGLCKKILIVCPVTLIGNWTREFGKWLGLTRIGVLTLHSNNTTDMDKAAIKNFLRVQRTYQVLIIGYEKLLNLTNELQDKSGSSNSIDLLVCDEGHRLKNGSSKILNVLKSLDVKRKVVLTGTPIQNDLAEFYTIVDFINPGILGSFINFKKHFILPITRARDTENRYNEDIQEMGEERSKELISITKRFTLRRTNDVLTKYLPPKTDVILFCKPTKTQMSAFFDILKESQLDFQHMTMNSSLGLITLLKKVCNSPRLLDTDSYYNSNINDKNIRSKYFNATDSGKLKVLMSLLTKIRGLAPNEKVVIVSNYTQTLDIIQSLLNSHRMISTRLDGSTPQNKRDGIVNSFNRNESIFAFLLSAKSGGVGLNLIGASRLILFDNDWNPSVDLQAMSRIHRQGQQKPCYIYRLVTTGCIDEKILQRQLMKNSLSQKFLDSSTKNGNSQNDDLFRREDLKDLFSILPDTLSNTHELICSCDGTGDEVDDESAETEGEKGGDNDILTDGKAIRTQLTQWTSAFEAKKLIEDLQAKQKNEENKFMKKCLIGYQHINPSKTNDVCDNVTSEVMTELKNAITFTFIKPASIFE